MRRNDMIDLIEADRSGKILERSPIARPGNWTEWVEIPFDLDDAPRFDFTTFHYRVKPELEEGVFVATSVRRQIYDEVVKTNERLISALRDMLNAASGYRVPSEQAKRLLGELGAEWIFKPAPHPEAQKPREWWIQFSHYPTFQEDTQSACVGSIPLPNAIHVREVLQ